MNFKVSDICDINASNLSSKDKLKYIKYLDTANLNEGIITELQLLIVGEDKIPSRAKRKVKNNDILISTVRPNQNHYGILKNIDNNTIVSTGFAVLSPKSNIVDAEYLYRFLTQYNITEYLQSIAETSTSTFPAIKPSVIGEIEILLPSLQEQKAISDILLSLDEKIELNNKMNKTLEEMAQALFKRWFIDFEFPNEDGEPYKSSGGEMADSKLGMIPKGWRVSSLDKIANYLNGLAMQKYRPESEEFIPVIKIKDLGNGRTDNSSDKASINIPQQYIINDGDVIFSWSGTLMVKIWAGGIGGLNQHLFKVTSDEYDKWYYYLWTNYHLEKFKAIAKDKATTMGHIKRSNLTEAAVLIPNMDAYGRLNHIMKPIIDKIIEVNVQIKQISELRDSLLPKLMSGEIRVEEIEANL